MVGCELGGATKNVIALAVGMAVGLGLRGERDRVGDHPRAGRDQPARAWRSAPTRTRFSGLAGLGDLVATCSSPLSRNRTFGEELGRGRTVAEISRLTRQVAEGVKSCASIQELAARHGVEMPIVEHVAAVIAGDLTPAETDHAP